MDSNKHQILSTLQRKSLIVRISLIIILGFVVYANSLNGKFIWDDYGYIKDNVYIKGWSYLPKLFTSDIGEGSDSRSSFYRPLQMTTYAIDYSLWGFNVFGFHFVNIMLHILVALSIYWLIITLFNEHTIAFMASALFVVHPIHTEAVASMAGRADSLSALFIILCIISYIKQQTLSRNPTLYALTLLSCVCAILSKENAVIIPLVILLYHYTFKNKIHKSLFLYIAVIMVIYILLRITILKSLMPNKQNIDILLQRIPGLFVGISNYLRLLVLPFHLRVDYGNRLFHFSDPKAMLGILAVCVLIIYAFRKRNAEGIVFFSILWFFISLLPVTNIYQINDSFMKEHWLYIPSVGFLLLVAKKLNDLYKINVFRMLMTFCIISILLCYSYLTIKQNNYWKDPFVFLERTLQYSPDNPIFYNELGIEYTNIGKYDEAASSFKKALAINPYLIGVYENLANIYKITNQYGEAIAAYKKAIEINPDDIAAYNNLCTLYNKIGNKQEAIVAQKKVGAINSKLAKQYYEIGNMYENAGRNKEAIAVYRKALKLDPNNLSLYSDLANVYVIRGKYKEAEVLLQKAIEINPRLAIAYNNLAVVYYYQKQYDLAIKYCGKAMQFGYKTHPAFLKLLEPHREKY